VLQHLVNGLSQGAIYAFIALGYTMVYGIIKLINFAHGEFFMVGAFAGFFVLRDAGIERLPLPQPLPLVLAYAAALLAGGLASAVLATLAERLCYRPIRRAGRIAALLTAVGLSLLLQNLARQTPAIGPTPHAWPTLRVWSHEGGVARAGEEAVISQGFGQALVIGLLAIASLGVWFLVARTRTGKAMRAVSEDLPAAQLMGVDANAVIARTFFLGGLLAGIGGVVYCTTADLHQVEPMTGFMPGLKAFVAAVLGGIGSIPGAVLGGVVLGVAETLFGAYVSTRWKELLVFVVLILVLLVKPTGLLGTARREKV
jgi:branched-chain amino acid transport system permease protein